MGAYLREDFIREGAKRDLLERGPEREEVYYGGAVQMWGLSEGEGYQRKGLLGKGFTRQGGLRRRICLKKNLTEEIKISQTPLPEK